MAAITQAEFAKTVQDPLRRGIIETTYVEEPVFGLIPFRTVPGLALPYNQEESLPSVAFRDINEAFSTTVGVVNRKVETLKPFGGMSDTDIVLVDAYGDEERTGRDSMFAKAMSVKYVQTMLYGNSGLRNPSFVDVSGFDGIESRITSGQTIDAAGTGTSTGSSVFAIRFGDGYCQGLQTPSGIDVKDKGEIDNGIHLRTRIQHVAGWAIFNGKAVAWIKDLAATTQVLTRQMMDDMVDLVVGRPSVILMSKRSRAQLKTNIWGAASGGPAAGAGLSVQMDEIGNVVEQWNGIPIYVSDAILDTETMP